jgi:hypothetical protein
MLLSQAVPRADQSSIPGRATVLVPHIAAVYLPLDARAIYNA